MFLLSFLILLLSGQGEGGGWCDSIEKNCAFFRSRCFLVLTVFKLKPNAKYESIPSNFACFHKYISCVYCCIWSHVKVIASYYIIYSKGAVPYEGKYAVYFASPTTYYTTLLSNNAGLFVSICLYLSLCHVGK